MIVPRNLRLIAKRRRPRKARVNLIADVSGYRDAMARAAEKTRPTAEPTSETVRKAAQYTNGGFGLYSGGTPLYRFAEPETGWEYFVSGKRGMERQNLGYAYESINPLQAQIGGTVRDNSSLERFLQKLARRLGLKRPVQGDEDYSI